MQQDLSECPTTIYHLWEMKVRNTHLHKSSCGVKVWFVW